MFACSQQIWQIVNVLDKYYQILRSSHRWHVGFMPRAYSDQREVTALSLVMRRILRFRLNIQKIVLHQFTIPIGMAEAQRCSTRSWKHSHQTNFLGYSFLDKDPVASTRQISCLAGATNGRVVSCALWSHQTQRIQIVSLGIEEN